MTTSMSDDTLARIKELLAKATPQNIDTAEVIGDDYIECPVCDGQGEVQRKMYTNYDGAALSVGFFGFGNAHLNAEALFRALVKHVPTLISRLEAAEARAAAAGAAWQDISTAPKDGTHFLACDANVPYGPHWTFNQRPPTVVHWHYHIPGEGTGAFYTSVNELAPEHPFPATHWKPLGAPPIRAALTANPKDTGAE